MLAVDITNDLKYVFSFLICELSFQCILKLTILQNAEYRSFFSVEGTSQK